jgi:hypothetical protein
VVEPVIVERVVAVVAIDELLVVVVVTGNWPPRADTMLSKNPGLPYTCDISL